MGPSKKGKEREEPFLREADRTDKAVAGAQMVSGAVGAIGALAPIPIIKDAAALVGYIAQIVKVGLLLLILIPVIMIMAPRT